MSRTVIIGSVNYAGSVVLSTMRLVTSADRGNVGVGSMQIEDPLAAFTIPAWKAIAVEETAEAAQWERIFQGYVGNRIYTRGAMKGGVARTIDVDLVDINHRLDEAIIRTQGAIRDSETDVARVTWLSGHTSLSFLTTSIIQPTATVTMDPTDYRDGTALDVLRDCAEASGKNFYLTYNKSDLFTLVYAKTSYTPSGGVIPASGNTLTGTLRISDLIGDQDGSTFFPISASRALDASKVYSGVNVNFDKGSVYATASGTETAYKQREINIESEARTSDGAENVATNFLDNADADEETIRCSVLVDEDSVGQFEAGYRVQTKLRALGDPSTFTYRRITQRTIQPAPGEGGAWDKYQVDLEFQPRTTTHRPVRVKLRKPRLDNETVPNSGFENGPHDVDNRINDWHMVAGTGRAYTGIKHGGSRSLRIEQDVLSEAWTEDFAPVQYGRRYLLRGYFFFNVGGATYGANPPQMQIAWYNSAKAFLGYSVYKFLTGSNKNKWNRGCNVQPVPLNGAYRKIRIYCPAGTAGRFWYFDDITFEETDLSSAADVPLDSA